MSKVENIKQQLWQMANKLRGTMDAGEYKNYILPFMFYRYLSENQEDYLKKNALEDFYTVTEEGEKEDYLQEISRGIGYVIESDYTWNSLVTKIDKKTIKASDYQDMFLSFETNAKRNEDAGFSNIFSDVNLGDTRLGDSTNERAMALNDIVEMIDRFEFKDESGRDILGDVYQYLIGEFAASAGKKSGEFYTPYEVSKILSKIVTLNVEDTGEQFRVYDLAMGSGSLLLTVKQELPYGDTEGSVKFYGQELNTTTYNLARMNMMMHGVNYKNLNLRRADTLDADWPFEEKNGTQIPLTFDAVVANPPYSQHWDNKTIDREKDQRFRPFGVAPASKADYAFVLHGIYHLDDRGTMAIVLPHGVLFRGGAEGKIRKKLIQENLLDAVIGLPPNLFYGTSIPTCILVFKGRAARNTKDILFIDASAEFVKSKNKNTLSADNVNKILNAYEGREDIDKYAYVADLDEIKENEYNLNIPRYVDTFEEEELIPLTDVASNLVKVQNEITNSKKNIMELVEQLVGTNDEAKEELDKFIEILGKK